MASYSRDCSRAEYAEGGGGESGPGECGGGSGEKGKRQAEREGGHESELIAMAVFCDDDGGGNAT